MKEGVQMSIKPIDFQVMIPKTTDVSKISNNAQQRSIIMQQQGNTEMKNKVDRDLRQVNNKEAVRYNRIEVNYDRDSAYEGNSKKYKKKKQENAKETYDGFQESHNHLDVKV